MTLQIHPIPAFSDNYIWLLSNPENQQAVCVDPGDAAPVLAYLQQKQLMLTAILITHHHWDHSGGIAELLAHTAVSVYGPAHEKIAELTQQVGAGDKVLLDSLNLSFSVLEIPGHTSGHIAYYGDDKLFCGDTLFAAGCGRVFEGTPTQMFASLQQIANLPDETLIYCAHEYTENNLRFAAQVEPNNQAIQQRLAKVQQLRAEQQVTLPSQLALEKQTNPFLRCGQPDVIAAAEQYSGKTLNDPVAVFAVIRQWKDHF